MAETGVVVGIVEDIKDPEKLGRVRVKLPHLGDQLTYWARLATLTNLAPRDVSSILQRLERKKQVVKAGEGRYALKKGSEA